MPANVETMMYAGIAPWHNLGKRVPAEVNAEQCIKLAELDWEVAKVHLLTENGTSVPDFWGIQRMSDNSVLSVVGDRYTPVQNRRAFDFFDAIVGSGKAIYHTAGSLDGGRRIWILAKLPGDIEVGKGDGVEKFLLLCNAHDGSMKCSAFFTPIRVVCQNTLTLALNSNKKRAGVEITHTTSVNKRLTEAEQILQAAHEHYDIFATLANKLAETRYTPMQLAELVKTLFPASVEGKTSKKMDEKRVRVMGLFENGAGHDKIEGTAWAALNAVAEFVDHNDMNRKRNDDKRVMDIWFGGGIDLKQQALEAIIQQTNVSLS